MTTFDIKTPIQERFTRPGGTRGEVGALGKGVKSALSLLAPIALADMPNPIAGIASDNDQLMASTASSLTPRTLTLGASGAASAAGVLTRDNVENLAIAARQINFLTGGTAAQQYDTAIITGKNAYGARCREVVTLAKTATSVLSKNYFSLITKIELTAGTGSAATLAISVGNTAGLPAPAKKRGSAFLVFAEWVDGAVAGVAGVVAEVAAVPNVAPVYYSYTPNTAFNGVHDYALFYEFDPDA